MRPLRSLVRRNALTLASLPSDGVIQQVVLGMDIWPILALFSVIVLVIGTFISHTCVEVATPG